jgi:beta-glucanase (GH16 family)
MFLYYDPSYMLGEEPWNEIDIEVLGTNPGVWQSNLITRLPDEGKKNPKITSEYKTGFGFNSTEDFHLFAFVWTPEYISWEIDSVEVRRDVLGMAKGQVEFMTKEQTLRFNLWASKSAGWTGKYTGAELADGPVAQWIDYVRVYSYDPETKTFAESWTDNFDGETLDRTRWSRGNWEMENVMLSVDNVVVEDGYCKLLMTRTPKLDPAPAE